MNLSEFLKNNADIEIKSFVECTGLSDSTRVNTISFLDNARFAKNINNNKNIVAVFVREVDLSFLDERIETIVVENPKSELFGLHNEFYERYLKYEKSIISSTAQIHETAFVTPEGVTVEDNVVIGPNCTILPGVMIGKNSKIGANCVLGSEGFHLFTDKNGIKRIVKHDGLVKIGKNVDIGASVNIDKGLMGENTVLEDECKIDNLVHIAHRAKIGSGSSIVALSCVAGSAVIEKNVWIGANVTISNRIKIGESAKVLLGSVVIRNVRANSVVSGNFARNHEKHLREYCN